MAEYYPLLAKAVGSLPNSTSDTRRVVYERARKALIGQLRTLHPPVPDEDIEHESVELDRAIERLEAELASAASAPVAPRPPAATPPKPATPAPTRPEPAGSPPQNALQAPTPSSAAPARPVGPGPAPLPPLAAVKPSPRLPSPRLPSNAAGGLGPPEKSIPALRTKLPSAKPLSSVVPSSAAAVAQAPAPAEPAEVTPPPAAPDDDIRPPRVENAPRGRSDAQRPIAPMPPMPKGPKRRMWIIPVGIFVVALVAFAAWKLRDRPQTVARVKPAEQTQGDQGKIAERIGGPATTDATPAARAPAPAAQAPASAPAEAPAAATPAEQPAAANPDLPVAHRAAMLVEAPEETNKVKTFLGNVVWKLNTVNEGPNDAASLAVEADVDLPDDKMKAVVTFEKNTDTSLPASHTIKIRFYLQPGSVTGDVKQISVPQVRNEDSPSGEALSGVTVPVIQNSFLVGLSPGAETNNLQLLKGQQWIDIPMLMTSGKIAKLTFEKSDSGQRDITEAIAAWQKS